jgi:hypothetical protein
MYPNIYVKYLGVNLGGRARTEEKIMCKVVGAIEFSNLEHDICRVKIRISWVWQFTLQSAQRHNQILKIVQRISQ